MAQLSERLNRLSPSETLAMSQKSSELKAQGIDIINMSVGEPDFNTPEHIKEAAKKAIDDNYSKYSPVAGYPALRNAIVAKLKNENGLDYTAAQISCANGAKQSVCNTIMTLVNAGDEVIIPAPYWVSYPEMVKLADGTPVTVPAGIEQDFKITPAQLEAAITPKTKLLILCSPSNPTGSVYNKEELAGLAAVLAKHPQVYIIADEIYEHINYIGKHESIAQFKEIHDRVVIVNGVSKAYAMTGWRIGFIAGPEWIVKAVNKLQGQYTSGPCSVSQKAAEAAKKLIDNPCYELYRAGNDNPYEDYYGVTHETWNKELIWTDRYNGLFSWGIGTVPTGVAGTAYGAVGPTQALVDAYAMNTGWYPITGYEADGTPIVEPLSGYELASELEKSSWIYPSGGWSNKADFEIEAPNMYKDREPRFYVTVFFGGNQWLHGNSATSISFAKGGNGNKSHDYPKSGYLCNRFYDHKLNSSEGQWGNITFPVFRLGEIYLNFIEAVQEEWGGTRSQL